MKSVFYVVPVILYDRPILSVDEFELSSSKLGVILDQYEPKLKF
jgi:hypothetical protein